MTIAELYDKCERWKDRPYAYRKPTKPTYLNTYQIEWIARMHWRDNIYYYEVRVPYGTYKMNGDAELELVVDAESGVYYI